jgi:hypothetical protein
VSGDAKKKPSYKLPDVRPGNWRREILGGCTINFGQVVQPGPPRQSVEFTYVIRPAAFTMLEARFTWPGVIMIMTPTPMKKRNSRMRATYSRPSTFLLSTSRLWLRAGSFRTC